MIVTRFVILCLASVLVLHIRTSAGDIIGYQTFGNLTIPTIEYEALYNIYSTTNGDWWTWAPQESGVPWNFSANANPCNDHWQGIGCNYTNSEQEVHVTMLVLPNHNMTGNFPESISNLSYLTGLALDINHLNGTIPRSIGTNLPNLTELSLTENTLHGSLPAWIGDLTKLKILSLADNHFTGPIPISYGNLTRLTDFNIAENKITGTLPAALATLTNLKTFYIFDNVFTGTIPDYLCNMVDMILLGVYLNQFHGGIPTCVGNLKQLRWFMIYGNILSGTIPPEVGQMSSVELLWMGENRLHGSIPDSVSQLTNLQQLISYENQHTGPLPKDIGNCSSLLYLEVYMNHMTGSLPWSLGFAPRLQQVIVHHNMFSHTLPASLGNLHEAVNMYLGDNHFTGTVPRTLSQLPAISELFISHNYLTGTLDGVFNSTIQINLTNVQVDYNELTGTLPEQVFLLSQLNTFVAVSNCLTGTIPEAVCTGQELVSLILDGFQSAPACRRSILPSISKSYIVHDKHQGTLPTCIFTMPKLTSLHVSGNGLMGTLPDITNVGSKLVDMKISYNSMRGTVPMAFQMVQWKNLDLSYNRFTGTLSSKFASINRDLNLNLGHLIVHYNLTNASIVLQNNRLSGKVPSVMVHQQNISILGTNLFSCRLDKRDLPGNDEDHDNYECASDSFNTPFYVFLGLTALVAAVAVVSIYHLQWERLPHSVRICLEWVQKWTLDKESLPHNFKYVCAMSDILCKMSVYCTAVILIVLVPWYTAASYYYGTYYQQYAWTVSAAFLSGSTVTAVQIFFYLALILAFVAALIYLLVEYKTTAEKVPESEVLTRQISDAPVLPTLSKGARLLVYLAFMSVNVIVVVSANVAFVYVALYESNAALLVAQLFLSLFKLMWNNFCAPFLLRFIANHVSRLTADFVTIQIIAALFNNIAIPCLVVAVVSPSCFNSVFRSPSAVDALYTYEQCTTFTSSAECILYTPTVQSTSFDPPFLYDYQCSSSLITYYGPAFVYLAIAATFGTPLVKLAGQQLLLRAEPGTFWFKVLDVTVPRILRPISYIYENRTSNDSGTPRPSESLRHTFAISYDTLQRSLFHPYFDANMFIISLLTYLGILLTFGVVFPPIALAMSVTMISVAWQAKLAVGRFLYQARELNANKFVKIIEQECKGAVTIRKISRSIFMVVCFSCTFYSLFLFDTLGDSAGVEGAYWVLILMPLFPMLIYGVVRLLRDRDDFVNFHMHVADPENNARKSEIGLPLTPMHSFTAKDANEAIDAESISKMEENTTYNVMRG
uniref:Uncharacterized protein n=1 Tax=Spumella elongata TaxID=89044 RepID=A0A7S3HLI2_9STRA|mmetsp:Transcript_5802/g.9775  ORF Transcript_5802/g.9775 Transcript_5802/m.9775 type:complete len:1286 (+) Transcript_5802:115-3972(+)|eukprot:CAMPEP_0184992830 /NCGR_PEP_ID=MMETSP1098-20130426/42790_1 /TAXON_ID=89044 /ORGANISM="Spumella elongata, Strain CCAP 955/1" /LENGTH=1285 /DNA_ID=CAMNT_0027518537 /DNA_START=115 /DNA_END=3972 /DNA_ORIENTATION=-